MCPSAVQDQIGSPPGRQRRFLTNVLWNWLGVFVNVLVGLIASRYIVLTLGEEGYGVWALVFALVEYIWFFDLGINTALVNFIARHDATGERRQIDAAVNTALLYFSGVAVAVVIVAVTLSRNVDRMFHVSPAYSHDFARLVLMMGLAWAVFVLLHIFTSSLEGLQRFDITARAWIATLVFRTVGLVAVLIMGYGLIAMGTVVIAGQLLGYAINVRRFRQIQPTFRVSPETVTLPVLRQLIRYGVPAFVASTASLVLSQSAPILIGHFWPVAQVGYYALPSRMLQYIADAVGRVGLVTRSGAAALDASRQDQAVRTLGVYANRYCFTLFAPVAIFLLIYGRALIEVWVGPGFASQSTPLLFILVPATAIVTAGQFNSSAILFGLGAHRLYAYGLVVEAVMNVAALLIVIPRYGIVGAAWVTAICMLAARGLYTPWVLCRRLELSLVDYFGSIYFRATATALPVASLAYLAKTYWLDGRNWRDVACGLAIVVVSYLSLAWFTAVERVHRQMIGTWVAGRWRART